MPTWTHEQNDAITEKGGALLVSAAAGSGKTAVLVERVIRKLVDEKKDIDKLLLVTYTNAAAAEMRSKIANRVTKELAIYPDDIRLRRQLMLIHNAQITTVHSFCLNIVREQFAFLGLSPDFRIADEGELAELYEIALENTLEMQYASENAGFLALSNLLSTSNNDNKLSDMVLELFHKIQSHAHPDKFLDEVDLMFTSENGADIHKNVLVNEAKLAAEYGLECLKLALSELESDLELKDAYAPALESDVSNAMNLLDALNKDWDTAVNTALSIKHERLGSIRGYEDKDFQEYIRELRKGWRESCDKIEVKLLSQTNEQHKTAQTLTAPAMLALTDTVRKFSQQFTEIKLQKNVVDFGDLEHYAVKLLFDGDKPSDYAVQLSHTFDEIMVDEYQDSNAVQEAIFRAVSKNEQNLFFVGDVKQSIYGFRLANPFLFLAKYQSWSDHTEAKDGEPRKLNLTRNFRSRSQVLEATNYIFRNIMSGQLGDLDYTDKEALYTGADYPNPDDDLYKTEVLLLDTQNKDEDSPEKTELEAALVANRIQKLLDDKFPVYDRDTDTTRPITQSDIVILLRSISKKAAIFRKALEKIGLSAQTDESTGLLETSEVRSIVSLLHIIDNPRQDVELIGALSSELIGFTEDELASLRVTDKKAEFYDVLLKSAENGDKKVQDFLSLLRSLRTYAIDYPICVLLEKIYDITNALGIYGAMPAGKQRQRNLLAFFERAKAFESGNSGGLFRFTALLRGMAERGEDWQAVQAGGEGAVRIMSIHKSKGLEFPVVFVSDCAKSFNEQDLRAPVLVHPSLGLGPKCLDEERNVQYPTIWRHAVSVKARREAVSEELRVLYVALTRAKEKLIITASGANIESTIKKLGILSEMGNIPTYALSNMRSYLPWILVSLMRHPSADALRLISGTNINPDHNAPDIFDIKILTPDMINSTFSIENFESIQKSDLTVNFSLPENANLFIDIPSKLTATGLKKGYKAEETIEDTKQTLPPIRFRQPDFTVKKRGLTPAEKGTAHHLFMQFCNFSECTQPNGAQNELNRLKEKRILSKEQADAIDITKIERFFSSNLYKNKFSTSKLIREFKFSVVVPAHLYYKDLPSSSDETVLLQGVIDCLLETDNGFIVVDFKTDHVWGDKLKERANQYKTQLDAYAHAVNLIFEKPVIECVLYFLNTGDEVTV